MVEILSVDISKNPVATNERFILSVSVRPYFTTGIGIKGARRVHSCKSKDSALFRYSDD